MYKPYRAALKAIRREFDRAASRYPRLFHEMLEYNTCRVETVSRDEWKNDVELLQRACATLNTSSDSPDFSATLDKFDDFSDIEKLKIKLQLRRQRGEQRYVIADSEFDVWVAFFRANHTREDGAWQRWEIMSNLGWAGRFFGAEDGLEDFERLGNALGLILSEIQPLPSDFPWFGCTIKGCVVGYHRVLFDIYSMAKDYPSPLLRIYDRMWDYPRHDPFCDEILDEWKIDQQGNGYPLSPYCWGLVFDVFTSAIAAIDAILEPDKILLLSESQVPSPFFGALKDIEEPQPEPPTTPTEKTPTTVEPFLFRREGDYWHLRFTSGYRVEEHKGFKHRVGLLRYQELLREKGQKISSLDLERLGKKLEGDMMTQREADNAGVNYGFSFDAVTDFESMKALKEEITKTEEALELARGQPAQLQSLNRKLKLLHKLKSESKLVGRDRRLGSPPPEEKARKAINRCFAEVREAIRHKMPSLELHLLSCVECENGDWVYKPSPDLDWSF